MLAFYWLYQYFQASVRQVGPRARKLGGSCVLAVYEQGVWVRKLLLAFYWLYEYFQARCGRWGPGHGSWVGPVY